MKIESSFLNNDFKGFTLDETKSKKQENTNIFSDLLSSISAQENTVSNMKNEYLNGERDDIQNILIEGQKLNLQVNFALQVRNNLVNAFQQIATMQV
ncbi:flagellar hook-basal body complex protein FliE (plasmid) [Clostridium perfringens]